MPSKISLNSELCTGCKACIELCPRVCFTFNTAEGKASLISDTNCHSCGHCISVCPTGAINHLNFSSEDYQAIKAKLPEKAIKEDALYHFLKAIRSTRKFKAKNVEREILEKLVDICRYAPSAKLVQNVELVVVTDQETIGKLKGLCASTIGKVLKRLNNPLIRLLLRLVGKGQSVRNGLQARPRMLRMQQELEQGEDSLFHHAPAIIVFHGKKKGLYTKENCNYAAAYFRTLAQSYQLGSCFIGYLENYAKYEPKAL